MGLGFRALYSYTMNIIQLSMSAGCTQDFPTRGKPVGPQGLGICMEYEEGFALIRETPDMSNLWVGGSTFTLEQCTRAVFLFGPFL